VGTIKMAPVDQEKETKDKINILEKQLADLQQGLCLVQDYYHDLEKVAGKQDAEEDVNQSLLKPLLKEDEEFEGIWKFHDEMLILDPPAQVPCTQMYESFVTYCRNKGWEATDRPSFDFIFLKMGILQSSERNMWQGYRIRIN
jgi:hypothetical protein